MPQATKSQIRLTRDQNPQVQTLLNPKNLPQSPLPRYKSVEESLELATSAGGRKSSAMANSLVPIVLCIVMVSLRRLDDQSRGDLTHFTVSRVHI